MSIQLLNRSLLATVVGAALALGTAGTSFARDRNSAQYDARTAQEEGEANRKGKARAEKAEREQQAVANERAEARADARARADLNARVNADRVEARARADANARARVRADNESARRVAARAAAARDRDQARARSIADARRDADRNAARHQAEQAQERARINRAAPYGQEVSAERHRRNAERQADRNRVENRVDRSREIARERARQEAYRDHLAERQRLARQRSIDLQRANRLAQYRYQQQYYERLRQMRLRDARYDWGRDPYFHTAPSYRYMRGGNYYQVNNYAADLLRKAVRLGYEEGYQAGRADRMDGWRYSYRDSFAYQDGNYGYPGYYVDRAEYNHYFRQGFQRGYEDGYYGQSRYGRYDNGNMSILEALLPVILNFVRL